MQGECDAWSVKRRPARGFSRFAREFLGENGVLFIRHLIDSYGANLRLPRVWKLFFVPVYARFCFLFNPRVPTSFLDARVTRMGQWKATKNSAEIRAKRRRPWRSI